MRVLILILICAGSICAEETPDGKAFQAASQLKSPKAKIAALDRFLAEFPTSTRAASARRDLIETAVEANPKDAVRRTKKMTESLPAAEAASLNRFLAAELNDGKRLPAEAERAAREALAQFTFEAFTANSKDGTPSRSRFNLQRAQMHETLAQTLLARGKARDEAKAEFLEALAVNPALGPAAIAVGDMLQKEGKSADALLYYSQGFLARGTPEARKKFSEAYVKEKGSKAGVQEYLDGRYKSLFPVALSVEKYKKSDGRTARVVLGEFYTGAGCPPCAGVDLAVDAALERFSRADVAIVMYHEHIPRPDPMANYDTVARWKWQGGRGVPTYALDGEATTGGGSRDGAAELESKLRKIIEKRLEVAPTATLKLSAVTDGKVIKTGVSVTDVAKESPDLVLNILLVEKELRYSGENGIRYHPMVVRSIASFPMKGEKTKLGSFAFNLAEVATGLEKHAADFEKYDERHNKDGNFRFMEYQSQIDSANLAVVAFVQDAKTKEVLQAVYAEPKQ